jgi:hypothetical protein
VAARAMLSIDIVAESLPGCRQPTRLFSSVQPNEPHLAGALDCFNIGLCMIGKYLIALGRVNMGAIEADQTGELSTDSGSSFGADLVSGLKAWLINTI